MQNYYYYYFDVLFVEFDYGNGLYFWQQFYSLAKILYLRFWFFIVLTNQILFCCIGFHRCFLFYKNFSYHIKLGKHPSWCMESGSFELEVCKINSCTSYIQILMKCVINDWYVLVSTFTKNNELVINLITIMIMNCIQSCTSSWR